RPEPAALTRGGAAPPPGAQTAQVRARLPGDQARRMVPLYDRDRLLAGNRVPGPAIVHQLDPTTVALTGPRARGGTRGHQAPEARASPSTATWARCTRRT